MDKNKNEKSKYNKKHLSLYDFALLLVEKIMEDYLDDFNNNEISEKKAKPQAMDSICNCISKAQKGQRLALGMDEVSEDTDMPQINTIKSNKDLNI